MTIERVLTIGCAIALLAGYTSERKLAGVVGLSGYLPLDTKFAAVLTSFHHHKLTLDAKRGKYENATLSCAWDGGYGCRF